MTPSGETTDGRRDWLLLGGAWLVLVVALAVWVTIDRQPPAWDSARQLERAVRCAEDIGPGRWAAIREGASREAPVVACAAAAIYRLYPSDEAAGQAVIFVALGLGMVATFLLARDLAGAAAAVPAAWLFGAAPVVIASAMRFQLDVPLAAAVASALFALCRTDRLTRTATSAVAGLILGLGMLVTPTFAIYVTAPIVWLVATERSLRAVWNLLLALAIAAAISVPWYAPRLLPGPSRGAPEVVTSTGPLLVTAMVQHLGPLGVLLLVVGLVIALVRRRGFAIVAFVVPLALVALARHDGARHTLPLLPAAAVLCGMAVAALPARARLPGLAVVGLVAAVQASTVAWGVPPAVTLPALEVPWVAESRPRRADWRHRDVLGAIAADSAGRPVTVSVLADHAAFSPSNFRYYARRDRVPLRVVRSWLTDPIGIDYIVAKSGDTGPRRLAQAGDRANGQLARNPALARVYPVIAEFPLPDASTASVRVRRVPDGVSLAPEALATVLEAAIRRQLGVMAREVDNLTLRIEHDAEIVRGRVQRILLSADSAVLADYRRADAPRLRVRQLSLVAEDVLINPFRLEADGHADLLDVKRLRVARAEVSGDDAQAFVGQLKPFRRTRLRLTTDAVYVTARQPGVDVLALVRVVPGPQGRVALRVERVSVGWIPLPIGFVNWLIHRYDPAERLASALPFAVEIARIAVTDQALRVGD